MSEPYPTYKTTPTLHGAYEFTPSQIDDWLNEYRATLQRVRWLQARLLEAGAIKRGAVKDNS